MGRVSFVERVVFWIWGVVLIPCALAVLLAISAKKVDLDVPAHRSSVTALSDGVLTISLSCFVVAVVGDLLYALMFRSSPDAVSVPGVNRAARIVEIESALAKMEADLGMRR